MAKVTAFTKDNLPAIRAKINAALEAVEKELGVKIDIGRISYTDAAFKTEMNVVIANGVVADPTMADVPAQYINELIKWRGKEALGKEVEITGDKAVIVGIKGKSYIFKWVPGSVRATKQPGLRRIPFTNFDGLDRQVRGI